MRFRLLGFEIKGDERGYLTALEEKRDIPFKVRRVYYIFATQPGVRRGFHAHRCGRQVAVCLNGSCKFLLEDGEARAEVVLDRPTQGLLLDPMIWHEMYDFSPDCILLVLADHKYVESDYIRNYDEFIATVGRAHPSDR